MNMAIIFAGGAGQRMGREIPKQFLAWNGKAILIQTLELFERCRRIDEVIVVSKGDWIGYTKELIAEAGLKKVADVIPGGETALESQYRGLQRARELHPHTEDIAVLIHDGVRPLVSAETIEKCLASVHTYGSAVTVCPAIETVIQTDEAGSVTGVLDRGFCRMAKAPQGFFLKDILAVHEKTMAEGRHSYIDSASMMFDNGFSLHTVEGEPENIKITTPLDYYMYCGIIKSREKEC